MPDESKHLDNLHKASFVEGQQALAKDVSAQRLRELSKTLGQVGEVVAETFDQADRIAESGDPHKQKLATLIKDGLLGAVGQMTTGRPMAEEVREAVPATPLSLENSEPSATSLPSTERKELEHKPSEPTKRGRGRPKKEPKD